MVGMSDLRLPGFPKNFHGLKRGTILKALDDRVRMVGLKKGDRIPIGYDGEYIRCVSLTWNIEQIVEEILRGVWDVDGELDLSDPELSLQFAQHVERLFQN